MIKHILTALLFIITLGSVGAYERDYIGAYQFVIQIAIAGAMAIIADVVGKL